MKNTDQFKELGISSNILKALEKKGYQKPTLIQEEVIPRFLEQKTDIIAQAKTGTGKTAAFAIPLLQLIKENTDYIQALILTPTRELALQVTNELESMKGGLKTDVVSIYGGQKIQPQIRALKDGADIVVGTPGRVLDHIRSGRLNLAKINYLVLDEADEMLDMGFQEDLEAIIKTANKNRKTLLFSATMPDRVKKISEKYMKKAEFIKVKTVNEELNNIKYIVHEVSGKNKLETLCRIFDYNIDFYGLIFCRTRNDVDKLTNELQNSGYLVDGLHGEMSQPVREKALKNLKEKKICALIATDVAARGIDINNLQFVINYAVPDTAEALVHRVGRTARAGKRGIAISLVSPSEISRFRKFEKQNKMIHEREKLPERDAIVENRVKGLQTKILKQLSEKIPENYLQIAEKLLTFGTPESVIGALLKEFQPDYYDISSIKKIIKNRKPDAKVNKQREQRRHRKPDRNKSLKTRPSKKRKRNK